MNNAMFSKFVVVDERFRIKKEKGGIYLHVSMDPYQSDDDNYVTCSVNEGVIEKTSKIKSRFPESLENDTKYLRVFMSRGVVNKEMATNFQELICRLLAFYSHERDEVIERYREYLPHIEKILENTRTEVETKVRHSTRTKELLKDINPEMYGSNYPRLCSKPPRIVQDEKEIERLKEEGYEIMVFPKESDIGPHYSYACDNHHQIYPYRYIYPGLKS